MEIWDMLDSEGKNTGKVIIKGEEIPEGFYHLGADIWIINSENKILIQKRSSKKRLSPNVWAMTGGSVIKGENSRETIERETKEELGIELNMNEVKLLKKFRTGKVWIDTYFIKQDIDYYISDLQNLIRNVNFQLEDAYSILEKICNVEDYLSQKNSNIFWNFIQKIADYLYDKILYSIEELDSFRVAFVIFKFRAEQVKIFS